MVDIPPTVLGVFESRPRRNYIKSNYLALQPPSYNVMQNTARTSFNQAGATVPYFNHEFTMVTVR